MKKYVVISALLLGTVIVTGQQNALTGLLHVICDSGCSGSGIASTIGAAVPSSAVPIAFKDSNGNLAYVQLDASGNIPTTAVVSTTGLATSTNQTTEITRLTTLTGLDYATQTTLAAGNVLTGAVTETAPATDTASSGLNGRLQRIAQRLTTVISTLGSPFQAGGSIGNTSFGTTNFPTTIDTNAGNVSASTPRVVIATNQTEVASKVADGSNVVLGATTDTKVATDANGTINAHLRGIVSLLVSGITVLSHAVTNAGTFETQNGATSSSTNAALECNILSTASTNSTSCKGSAGNLYGYSVVNTTATLYYLRLYNSSSAPTCSSATGFIKSIPLPASTTGNGIVNLQPFGVNYSTGIGYCITGGSGSTDNTNAATGLFGAVYYK